MKSAIARHGFSSFGARHAATILNCLRRLEQSPPPEAYVSLDSSAETILADSDHVSSSHLVRSLSLGASWAELPPLFAKQIKSKNFARVFVSSAKDGYDTASIGRLAESYARLGKPAPRHFFSAVDKQGGWLARNMKGEEVARVLSSFAEVDYMATKLCEHLERKVRSNHVKERTCDCTTHPGYLLVAFRRRSTRS